MTEPTNPRNDLANMTKKAAAQTRADELRLLKRSTEKLESEALALFRELDKTAPALTKRRKRRGPAPAKSPAKSTSTAAPAPAPATKKKSEYRAVEIAAIKKEIADIKKRTGDVQSELLPVIRRLRDIAIRRGALDVAKLKRNLNL